MPLWPLEPLGATIPALQRIEILEPGGRLGARFSEYPLPEVLIGILRGNLTGELLVGPEGGDPGPDVAYFHNGVCVSVRMPRMGVSVLKMLIDRGELSEDRARRAEDAADRAGHSVSRALSLAQLVPDGTLHEVTRARARQELVQLFGRGDWAFVFSEGKSRPEDAELTILETLPIVYEGVLSPKGQFHFEALIAEHADDELRLAETYPKGLDPFQWGPEVARVIDAFSSQFDIAALRAGGLSEPKVGAVVYSLRLVQMLEMKKRDRSAQRSIPPEFSLPATSDLEMISEASFTEQEDATERHEREWSEIAERLDRVREKNYFEVFGLDASAPSQAVERAYETAKASVRGKAKTGIRAWLEFLEEARFTLCSSERSEAYRRLAASSDARSVADRRKLEVEAKLDRVARALAAGRTAEAEYLLYWAEDLDPERRELSAHRAFLTFRRALPERRPEVAESVHSLLSQEAGQDRHLKLYRVIVLSAFGEIERARELLDSLPEEVHPLYELAARSVG